MRYGSMSESNAPANSSRKTHSIQMLCTPRFLYLFSRDAHFLRTPLKYEADKNPKCHSSTRRSLFHSISTVTIETVYKKAVVFFLSGKWRHEAVKSKKRLCLMNFPGEDVTLIYQEQIDKTQSNARYASGAQRALLRVNELVPRSWWDYNPPGARNTRVTAIIIAPSLSLDIIEIKERVANQSHWGSLPFA